MTQLVELRDATASFQAEGIKLYTISYDDKEVLAEFSKNYGIEYPLLSDIDSKVIRAYGILNEQVRPGDSLLYGIPYPGTYVVDEDGIVLEKFFHDSYKKRESGHSLLDAALGRVLLGDAEPMASGGGDGIRVLAAFHGGPIKQGAQRSVVVRFELPEGLHVYGEPVPEGMVPTTVSVTGPEGLTIQSPEYPPTQQLWLESLGVELPVWSGTLDIRVPVFALSSLASECRPLDRESETLEVEVRYQACNERECLLPRTETFHLDVPVQAIDVPNIYLHTGHGQREAIYDGRPHLVRLLKRKLRQSPLGFLRFIVMQTRLELAAQLRRWRG